MNNIKKIDYAKIAKSWHRREVIKSVNISAESGQFSVLCGENGSGKTTLLKIMTGLVRPDQCRVSLDGNALTWKQARNELIKNTLYLHQTPYMFSGSVYRNLLLSVNHRDNESSQKNRIQEVLEWAQLEQYKFDSANTLSGGQQQRVALARASLNGSSFLFLDEPTANMDARSLQRTLGLLGELKQAGTAIVVCTHNPDTFQELSDRVLILENQSIRQQEDAP